MEDIKISLCASANRVRWWPRLLESLKGNKIKYEVVFVGDVKPADKVLAEYPELKYIHATVKPAQCYQIAFWEAKGELILWIADDCSFGNNRLDCDNCLDIAYEFWHKMDAKYGNDKKTVVALTPCEDGGKDVQRRWHFYYGGIPSTPQMSPIGLINRNYFLNEIGGYHKEFISGQSENYTMMQVWKDGGRVEICDESIIYIHHRQVHPRGLDGREKNEFRKFYNEDRKVLENAWTIGGYGFYEKGQTIKNDKERTEYFNNVKIADSPQTLFEPFEKTEDVCYVSQGQKGQW